MFRILSLHTLGFSALALSGLQGCHAAENQHLRPPGIVEQFDGVYEPSGVVTLPDGDLLVIEDEANQPISIITINPDSSLSVRRGDLPLKLGDIFDDNALGRLEDLEGIARDDDGHLYAVTSHSKTSRHHLPGSRKKLIRFRLDDISVTETIVLDDFKRAVVAQYESVKDAISGRKSDLNIESLSYHRQNNQLMIGLRTPVIDERAVVITMENPDLAFGSGEEILLSDKLVFLDLDHGGIRAMAYDDVLGGYLILSRREDKKDKSFKLWLWSGEADDDPQRIRLRIEFDLDNAEGISPIRTDFMQGLMIVFDDGARSRGRGGHYVLLPYDQLEIDGRPVLETP